MLTVLAAAISRPAIGSGRRRILIPLLLGAALAGCGGAVGLRVSPDEVPELERRLAEAPGDADLRLRYAAALFAQGRCGDARVQAEAGAALRPDNAVTPLIQGQCLEAAGRVGEAVEVYAGYLRLHPDGPGAEAVWGRRLLAERTLAALRAEEALAREAEISARPPTPGVVAVLPWAVLGDDGGRFRSLSRGLAQMVISDLSLLERLRMVERLELQALYDEMALLQEGRVDPATAARVGRLVRAEALVQGALVVEGDGLRLEANLTSEAGTTEGADPARGGLRDLLEMEKRLAVSLADRLAGPLTPAEERAILDNGPSSVEAFVDWAEGLLLDDLGDFAGAAEAYRRAAAADPGFGDAQRRARRSAAAVTVIGRSPSEVVALGEAAERAVAGVSDVGVSAALGGAVFDVAPLGPEVAVGLPPGAGGIQTPGARQPSPVLPVDVLVRILVRIPR